MLPPGRTQEDKLSSGLRALNETLGPRLDTVINTVNGQVQDVESRSTKTVTELLGERWQPP